MHRVIKMSHVGKKIYQFSKKEVDEIFKSTRRVFHHYSGFYLVCVPKRHDFGRLLVITPRRTGIAVKRNKIRRQIKAIFYEEALFQKSNHDCLIIVKKKGTLLSFGELKNLVNEAYKNIISA